jgi:hypothetical protein
LKFSSFFLESTTGKASQLEHELGTAKPQLDSSFISQNITFMDKSYHGTQQRIQKGQ